jgi:hypothetical protein
MKSIWYSARGKAISPRVKIFLCGLGIIIITSIIATTASLESPSTKRQVTIGPQPILSTITSQTKAEQSKTNTGANITTVTTSSDPSITVTKPAISQPIYYDNTNPCGVAHQSWYDACHKVCPHDAGTSDYCGCKSSGADGMPCAYLEN